LQTKTKQVSVVNLIKQLQGYEEYAFSWEELRSFSTAPDSTLKKELARLCKKKELINLRKGFYLILPPRYASLEKLPIQLYVHKLFKYIDKPYYVGLFSAASIHGASHQQIQKEYIITTSPALRGISKNNIQIEFFNSKKWNKSSIQNHKSDAGMYNVSSPALTAIDLIQNHHKLGGINRVLANIEELEEEITLDGLKTLLEWFPNISAIQRLGFILEELQVNEELTTTLFKHLQQRKHYPILLSNKKGQKAGSAGNRWKIDINIELDNDL
jgi:predicted transcriptional regulator of viral defense system